MSSNIACHTMFALQALIYLFAEGSLSGRSEQLSDSDFLAKLKHIKNYLEICCLNSEPTDFKCYGWTIAKDYAQKVERGVEQNLRAWSDMSGGVQTDQLVLAQMDFPRPVAPLVPLRKYTSGREDIKSSGTGTTATKEKCRTYNTCKVDDKCDYETNNPDKKCILKHECNWCKTHLKLSFRHQEWACKKKN